MTYAGDAHLVLKTKVQVGYFMTRIQYGISITAGQPSEPQTARHTPHGWFKRNVSSKGPLSRPNAP